MQDRICTSCKNPFPPTDEYFFKHKNGKYGLGSWCKTCHRSRNKSNIQKLRDNNPEYGKDYYENNKEHVLSRTKAYQKNNPEKCRAQTRKWRNENPEKAKQMRRGTYLRTRERVMRYAKERYHKVKNNPLFKMIKSLRNRLGKARKRAFLNQKNLTGLAYQIKEMYENSKGCCYWCGVQTGGNFHLDHIMPLIRGGSNEIDNLCISCPSCNVLKNDMLPDDWMRLIGRL